MARNYTPPAQFVGDSASAVRIAVEVWNAKYGEKEIASQQPYIAQLQDSVWRVTGSLPANHVGGVAEVEINRRDAKILRVSHGL